MEAVHLLQLLSFFTAVQQVTSWIISVPTTITAVEGSCIVVPCKTQPHSRVIWYKYHNINYPVVYDGHHLNSVEAQFRGRTSVVGKSAEGNCTLKIDNVKPADNNLQVYVWINPDSERTQKFHQQTITIFVERRTPIISVQRQLVEGGIFEANCSIKHSCPVSPPLLHWTRSPVLENSTSTGFNTKAQGQWLHGVSLHGKVTRQVHNSKIRCSAQFKTLITESQQITLNVFYKPASVTLIPEKEEVMEGDSVTIECATDSNPDPHMYSWIRRQMGKNSQINSTEKTTSFHNITRDTSLSCMAHNDIGAGQSNWVDLDVQYAPIIQPESSCSQKGNVMKCVCLAEASPNASITWIIDGNDTFPSLFPSMSFIRKNVASGEIHLAINIPTNVSCTAWNQFGSDTKEIYSCSTLCQTDNSSKMSSSFIWIICLLLLGSVLLLGCVPFIHRKYPRNRSQQSAAHVEFQRYVPSRRAQDEDSEPKLHRPERNAEEDRLSSVYDNDFVEDMRRSAGLQQHQNNSTPNHKNGGIQMLAENVHCILDDYLVTD
ncbi:B-cell receptor CD22-like [Leuresthes tenuis]|uniref:B-cell receptor CD22-like n=1 Tax=Leuresthes tenuis TaxID=355514 RepID=UPI003B5064CC